MGIDFRALARTAELIEPATEGTPGSGAGGSGTPCSYCGGTYFEPTEDNGRVQRAECEECGGTMVSHDGTYWQPDLIGSPHNHPSPKPDPASGGVGGAGTAPVKVREEDLSSRTAGANGPLPEGLEVSARPFEPGSDEHNDLERSYPGGKHGVIEAFVPERDDPIGSMEFSATPRQVHVHLTMVHSRYRRRGVATALNTKLHEIYPNHPIDRGAASEDGEHFRHSLGGVDWCRHRHGGHCWLPSNYASPPGLALWTPQDRGVCPWATAGQQQINCPMSEPGPMAGMTRAAAWVEPEWRFHVLAAWRDVRAKAVRIRREGGVSIVSVLVDGITGHVNGDTGIYETQINYVPGTFKVGFWQCGCAWAAYAWGRSPAFRRFEGRMCSHALALTYEAQSRGMFGREVREDTERPSWMRQRTPVQVEHDRDSGERRRRRAVPPANMRRTFEGAARPDPLDPDGVYPSDHGLSLDRRPIEAFAALAYAQSGDPADAMRVLLAAGMEHAAARDLLWEGLNASLDVWATMLNEHPHLQNLVDLGDHLQVEAAKDAGPAEQPPAGVVNSAAHTGRILMIQRSNKDPDDPAAGTWEFPGGGREDGDHHSLHSGIREFEEEVGQPFPLGGHVQHVWQSPNGVYQGHVVVVPSEDCLDFSGGRSTTNPDDPDGDDHEQSTWWDPDHARKNPALRPECRTSPWSQIKAASLDVGPRLAQHDLADGLGANAVDQRHAAVGSPWQRTVDTDLADDLGGQARVAVGAAEVPGTDGPPALDHVGHVLGVGAGNEVPEVLAGRVVTGVAGHGLAVVTEEVPVGPLVGSHEARSTAGQVGAVPEAAVALGVDGAGPRMAGVGSTRAVDLGLVAGLDSERHDGASLQEFRRRVADYAAHDTLGDLQPDYRPKAPPQAPGPGQPENPASTGFATSQDPPEWENAAGRAESMSMQMWSSLEAELRDEPAPALPSTTADDEEDVVETPGERYRAQMRPTVPDEDTQLSGLNPTAAVSSAVAAFHASAGARALQTDGGPNDMDIAQAARQHLAGQGGIQRTALKDFSSAEQMELITEGAGQRARNFGDLKIEGTHYEALQQALAAEAALADPDDLFD
jgi:8-oxo-dGTP pyrophosphatase MutT (NUDIX family)